MTDITDNSKVSNLWKKSRGVVDVDKNATFEKLSQKEYINQVLNEEIFSSDVPNRIPGNLASWTNAPQPTQSEYSVENLDLSSNFTPGQTVNLGIIGHPELTYYHRWRFEPHPTANALQSKFTATTWYIPDTSFSNNQLYSIARNTISFKKGGQGDYQYVFYIDAQNGPRKVAELETPYKFVFDNQSGYILIYADDDSAGNWKISSTQTATTGPILASFIKYTGAKGAAAGGDGSFLDGLDASFNNVDISNNLNLVHNDLETGILQSKRIRYTVPHSTSTSQSIIIAKVEDDASEFLNATGYFTVELKDGTGSVESSEAHTKIHFLAGIITKEATNAVASAAPAPPTPTPPSSPTSITPITNTVNSQISISDRLETIGIGTPIAIRPIVDLTPGASEEVVSDDDENTLPETTVSSTSVTGVEFTGFIKVLSCIRQFHDQNVPNIGIESIELAHESNVNLCYLILNLKLDPPVTLLNFNVRLYKNSLNIMDTINHLQWTLTNLQKPAISLPIIKKLYIGAGPDNNSLYPNHPTEPFTATTQFTIIDNALNVQKDFNLKGNINLIESGGGSQGGVKTSPKILAPILNLYEHKLFTDADFGSDNNITNFSNGVWQTIATVEATPGGSANLDQRTAYAMFEIVDRSNAGTNYKFIDTLSFIVNFSALDSGAANASINLLSSTPTANTTGNLSYGYIKGIRARCGQHSASTAGSTHGGVNIQLLRTSGAPANSGSTNIRVNIYHNYKTLNTKKEINPFVLTSTGLNLTSNQNLRSAEIDLTTHDHGFASTFSLGMTSTFENATFRKITEAGTGGATRPNNPTPGSPIPIGIVMRGDLDMSTYYINNLNYLKMNGNLDMNTIGNNAIININTLTGGLNSGAYPKITFTTNDTEIFVSHGSNGKIKIGSGTDTAQQISMNTGGTLSLDMNNIEIEKTELISKIMDTHKEKTNRAYLQEFSFNTADLPLSYKSDNHSPAWGFGGVAGNGDWITIAVSGSFSKDNTSGPVSIGDTSNRWRVNSRNFFRAHALFELIDRSSSHHQSVKFYAGFKFGNPSLRVLSNNIYSKVRFEQLRIKYGAGTVNGNYVKNTYTGCVLQFQLRDSDSNGNGAASTQDIQLKVWQNTENAGWKISKESVIVKENNPRCYVRTDVARETNTVASGYPYNGGAAGGDSLYVPVGGSPYQSEIVVDTSRHLVLDTNNIYKGETIITDKLNAKDGSSYVQLANTGEGIKIYGDAGSLDGLLAQSSNNGINKNIFTINPNANTHTTFEVKLKHGPSNKRVETSGLSVNQDNIKLKVPLNLSTTTADILSGTYGNQTEYGKFESLGSNIGVELAASNTIGKNNVASSGTGITNQPGQLPVIRVRAPNTINNVSRANRYVMISESCYNLITRYGLVEMLSGANSGSGDADSIDEPGSGTTRRYGGDKNGIANGTKFYHVGLIQSFKGEDLNQGTQSLTSGVCETPFIGRGWFTGCAFGWADKNTQLKVSGRAIFALIVNNKRVIEWKSGNSSSANGSVRTYNFHEVVLDLPSEDWVWCGDVNIRSSFRYYPNENVYDAGLKFRDVNSLIKFEMIFPNGATQASDYIQLTDDTKINNTYRSQIRMNAFFASYPNL